MSSTLPAAPPKAPPAEAAVTPEAMFATLQGLRQEIDAVDDALHDLLMRRGEVVARVAALRQAGKIAFRPGREADIVRRLLGRHGGALPRSGIVRLWRELFAATTSTQIGLTISVLGTGGDCAALAREHFGALTPLRAHDDAVAAIAEVRAGEATAAVLPVPAEAEPVAWWPTLLRQGEPRVHVVARLPFWASRPEGTPQMQALVLAASAPDASSRDRSVIGFDVPPEIGRERLGAAFAAVGFGPRTMLLREDCGLVEVDGYVTDSDPRLFRLAGSVRRPVVLGAYAVPFDVAS